MPSVTVQAGCALHCAICTDVRVDGSKAIVFAGTRARLRMGSGMATEPCTMQQAPAMRVNGSRTRSTAMAFSPLRMARSLMACLKMTGPAARRASLGVLPAQASKCAVGTSWKTSRIQKCDAAASVAGSLAALDVAAFCVAAVSVVVVDGMTAVGIAAALLTKPSCHGSCC